MFLIYLTLFALSYVFIFWCGRKKKKSPMEYYKVLEWIPYDRFDDIEYIAEGSFSKVYSATWLDGINDNHNRKPGICYVINKPSKVALKVLNNSSKNISKDFIIGTKFITQHGCGRPGLIKYYGITQDPDTQNYALVLDFMENGSLRSYLDQNFNSITWQRRLNIMFNISVGLHLIHGFNLIHKDLHLGNVLLYLIGDNCNSCISDSGFCKPADEDSLNSDNKNIYGVMPYMAPEILRGKKYTKASDIYSFGIIMNEIISIIPPFNNEPHDRNLASDICRGKRPRIREEVPEFLKELIQKCWDANPKNRPTSEKIMDKLCYYIYENGNFTLAFIGSWGRYNTRQVEELEELSYDFTSSTQFRTHPQAIYTSRPFNFSNLPEPVNCQNQEEFS